MGPEIPVEPQDAPKPKRSEALASQMIWIKRCQDDDGEHDSMMIPSSGEEK